MNYCKAKVLAELDSERKANLCSSHIWRPVTPDFLDLHWATQKIACPLCSVPSVLGVEMIVPEKLSSRQNWREERVSVFHALSRPAQSIIQAVNLIFITVISQHLFRLCVSSKYFSMKMPAFTSAMLMLLSCLPIEIKRRQKSTHRVCASTPTNSSQYLSSFKAVQVVTSNKCNTDATWTCAYESAKVATVRAANMRWV